MSTIVVVEPDKLLRKRVASNGQVVVGAEFADQKVEIVVRRVADDDTLTLAD